MPANNSNNASVVNISPLVTNAPAIAGATANASGILCHVDASPEVGSSTSSVLAFRFALASSKLKSDSSEFLLGNGDVGIFPAPDELLLCLGVRLGGVIGPGPSLRAEDPVPPSGDWSIVDDELPLFFNIAALLRPSDGMDGS